MESGNKTGLFLQAILSLTAYILSAYFVPRTDFLSFIALYALLFIAFAWIVRTPRDDRAILTLGLSFRLAILFAIPWLSDDFYRFLWDGRLALDGYNPYEQIPQSHMSNGIAIADAQALFDGMNSPVYFSVYPPLNQLFFYIAAFAAPKGIWAGAFSLKVIILLFEVFNFKLIQRLLRIYHLPSHYSALYFLNPLVILELVGNAHFEATMITFLLLALIQIQREKWWFAGLFFGMAISVKLVPLLFAPLLLFRFGWGPALKIFVSGGLIFALTFLPWLSLSVIGNFSNSLDLYFHNFEFNSFIYQITMDLVPTGYELWVAPGLALTTLFGIVFLGFRFRYSSLPQMMVWAQGLYYILAAVVHPWYLSTMIAMNSFRPVLSVSVWSFAIGLSYYTYQTEPYQQSPALIALEYFVLLSFVAFDLMRMYRREATSR
jgi:alpha-1,6-mannosyltransferase